MTYFTLPSPSQFPRTLIDLCGMNKASFDQESFDKPYMALLGWSDSNLKAVEGEATPRRVIPSESQISTLLGLQIFKISNNLLPGNGYGDDHGLREFGIALKSVADTGFNWKGLLNSTNGATLNSLVDRLFDCAVTWDDRNLAELMLQAGANPNQLLWDDDCESCISALSHSLAHENHDLVELLLVSGSVYDQTSLKTAIIAGEFGISDRMLRSNPSLDLDCNYLDEIKRSEDPSLRHLKLDTATLLGVVCLDIGSRECDCGEARFCSSNDHRAECLRYKGISSLRYILRQHVAVSLKTMILASFRADIIALRLLMAYGGQVHGFNRHGFSCLHAACLSEHLQYGTFLCLLCSGAVVNIPLTHHDFGLRESPFHFLLSRRAWKSGTKNAKSFELSVYF